MTTKGIELVPIQVSLLLDVLVIDHQGTTKEEEVTNLDGNLPRPLGEEEELMEMVEEVNPE